MTDVLGKPTTSRCPATLRLGHADTAAPTTTAWCTRLPSHSGDHYDTWTDYSWADADWHELFDAAGEIGNLADSEHYPIDEPEGGQTCAGCWPKEWPCAYGRLMEAYEAILRRENGA